jgi:hypothetical protein
MKTVRTTKKNSPLILKTALPVDQNPAAVYIASLPAETGQRTQAQALRVIASTHGTDINLLNWGALRHQHTVAIRTRVAKAYSPATANKNAIALRRTLKQAWRLGQMTADEYNRQLNWNPLQVKPSRLDVNCHRTKSLPL